MGGIKLRDGTLVVGREPNQLDELALDLSETVTPTDPSGRPCLLR